MNGTLLSIATPEEAETLKSHIKSISEHIKGISEIFDNLANKIDVSVKIVLAENNTVVKPDEAKPQIITIDDVRAILTEKTRNGKTDKVRELINSYGVSKITDVDPVHYEELLKKAESI